MRAAWAVAVVALAAGCLGSGPRSAPDFAVVDLEGNVHDPTSMRGDVVIVDLMATWCVPCVAQMEHLNVIRDAYAEDDVQILSIDTDRSETPAQLEAWMEQNDARWPYAFDTDGVAQKLGLRILPKIVIIDPEGTIVFEAQGEVYPASMARVLNRYAEPRA